MRNKWIAGIIGMTAAISSLSAGNVSLIVGDEDEKGYMPRYKAVQKLDDKLTPGAMKALYTFLHKDIKTEKMKRLEINAIKNDIIVKMMDQKKHPVDLAGHLVDLYYDKNMDSTIRDYALQFMGQWLPRVSDKDDRTAVIKALFDAMDEKKLSNPGTALIALKSCVNEPDVDAKRVRDAAYSLVVDENATDMIKTTALQIAASLGHPKVVDVARDIVVNSRTAQLRMSAMATIGIAGNKSDLELLKKYENSSDIRLRLAAKSAIKKLNK